MNIKNLSFKLLILFSVITIPICYNNKYPEGFLPGTIVKTITGDRQIEQLIPHDTVIVYNFNRHRFAGREVYKVHTTSNIKKLTFLLINDEFLCLCPEHRLYSLTRQQWISAQELQADKELLNNSGKSVIVYARGEITNITTPVYNLGIKGKHNYLVSPYGVVVHNDFGLVLTVSYIFGSGAGISIGAFGGIAALFWLYEQCAGHKPKIDTSSIHNVHVQMNIISHALPLSNSIQNNIAIHPPSSVQTYTQQPTTQHTNPYANPLQALSKTLKNSCLQSVNEPLFKINFTEQSTFSALPNSLHHDGLLVTPPPPPIDQTPGCGPSPLEGLFNKPHILVNIPAQIEQQGLHIFPIADESFCPHIEGTPIERQDLRDNINAMGKENFKYLDEIIKNATRGRKTQGPSTIFEKPGNYEDALKDFESLNLTGIKDIHTEKITGKAGKLPDGRMVNVRTSSRDTRPTLEIQNLNKTQTKVRYGTK